MGFSYDLYGFTHELARRHFLMNASCYVYNMHQDTKSARLIAVCKRTLKYK